MGIIEKQATTNTIYSYLGAFLGFITVMWLPHLLSTDENGLVRILVSVSVLLAQIGNLGFSSVTIRFFPYFKNKEKGHHGFLFYGIIISLVGFLLCWITFLVFEKRIIADNQEKSKLLVEYLFYLMPLTLFTLFFNLFDNYLRASYNSVIGLFTKEFLQRILILIVLALYFFNFISFSAFVLLYVTSVCTPTVLLMYSIIKNNEWHVKPIRGFISKDLRNEILKLSFYTILSGSAGALIANIDTIMVNQMLGLSKTGVYGIAFYFGTIIAIPARSLYRISTSIVAEAFKVNDLEKINRLYNKSCNGQLTVGLLLFIGIWINIDNIMTLLPPEYESGKYVILFISAGNLIDMGTGINSIIVLTSKHYRYDAYFMFSVVLITILTNYLLIPVYGITGSAIATAITVATYNILRGLLIFYKYKMQPYDVNTIKLITIAIASFLIGYFIPKLNNSYMDILMRSSIVTLLFIFSILKSEASPEINNKIKKLYYAFGSTNNRSPK
ncbi:MAG: oligosaccharide flippase family protein [Bacteroidia bacterium]